MRRLRALRAKALRSRNLDAEANSRGDKGAPTDKSDFDLARSMSARPFMRIRPIGLAHPDLFAYAFF